MCSTEKMYRTASRRGGMAVSLLQLTSSFRLLQFLKVEVYVIFCILALDISQQAQNVTFHVVWHN